MPFPPKELYTIVEIASRWNVSEKTIEDYLLTDFLQASIILPRILLYQFSLYFMDLRDEEQERYIKTHGMLFKTTQQGMFNLANYPGINWQNGQCILEKGTMCLSLPEEGYFGFTETFILNRDDVLIALSELKRFEEEHGITIDVMTQKVNSQIVSDLVWLDDSTKDSKLSIRPFSQKDNLKDTTDSINPKRESTLLTVIAALLEVILGESVCEGVKKIKHPSIINQRDLIDKLAELGERGLSKRNLEGIFSEAKKTKKDS